MIAQLRRSSIRLLALIGIVVAGGLVSPALADAAVSHASSTNGSVDVCVVLPGFATPPALFHVHTIGAKKFDKVLSLQASACGSLVSVPSGKYTLFQSFTSAGWHLANIDCFTVGSADHPTGTVDLPSASVTISLNHPTVCLFAELPGGGGGPGAQSAGTPTARGGTTTSSSTTTSSTTTTTSKSTTPSTFCVQNPDYPPNPPPYFCTNNNAKIG